MPAYVISETTIIDDAAFDRYRSLAAASIAHFGGRYLIRGGNVTAVEGAWPADQRLIVVEFPTMARALEWYESPEYAKALAIRGQALRRRLVFVEGPESSDSGRKAADVAT